MRFSIEQRFAASAEQVARAYTDPELYRSLHDLPKLTPPEVLEREMTGDLVLLSIRYRFNGELSAAARAVLDPDKLSWVEQSRHDLGSLSTSFEMVPDHYRDRFSCRGIYRFEDDAGGSVRRCEADLRVRALLVAGAVENAIVSGLREYLEHEGPLVDEFIDRRS